MGRTFKENCPDTRNTKVLDLVKILKNKKAEITIFDPLIKIRSKEVAQYTSKSPKKNFLMLFLSVYHTKNLKNGCRKNKRILAKNGILFDVKAL